MTYNNIKALLKKEGLRLEVIAKVSRYTRKKHIDQAEYIEFDIVLKDKETNKKTYIERLKVPFNRSFAIQTTENLNRVANILEYNLFTKQNTKREEKLLYITEAMAYIEYKMDQDLQKRKDKLKA